MAGIEKRVCAIVPKPHPDLLPRPPDLPRPIHYRCDASFQDLLSAQKDTRPVASGRIPLASVGQFLGIPPEYLEPLKTRSKEWQKEVVAIAKRRKVQDPSLPWPADPSLEDLKDSSPCLMGGVQSRTPGLSHPYFRTNLMLLAEQFLKLRENQWLQPMEPMDFEEWVERFPDHKRVLLRQARVEAERDGLSSKDAVMAVFIKTETSTTATDPRNISPRQLKFLSVLGPFVAAIERAAKHCEYLVKGRNPEDRGAHISQYWRGAVIETDFSRFDMTVSLDIIRLVERRMFRKAFPAGTHSILDELLPLLETLQGVSAMGVRYSVAGTRASGDAHTSIANGVVNRFVIWASLRNMNPTTWVSFHEGDDGIIHCDKAVKREICDNLSFASFLGFKLKVVEPLSHAHANFCGRSTCEGCFREMCDLPRALAKFPTTFKQGELQSLILAKALSYLATDSHTPIISIMCRALVANLSPKVSARLLRRRFAEVGWYDRDRLRRGLAAKETEILPCCRAHVAEVFGWCPALQLAWEHQLAGWEFGVSELPPVLVESYLTDTKGYTIHQG